MGRVRLRRVASGHQATRPAFGGGSCGRGRYARQDVFLEHAVGLCSKDYPTRPGHALPFLIVERETLPNVLEVRAWTENGTIMGLRPPNTGRGRAFHPEILSRGGRICCAASSRAIVSEVLKAHLRLVLSGSTLSGRAGCSAMGEIMDGAATPAQIGALLAALAVRGETADEIVGFAG